MEVDAKPGEAQVGRQLDAGESALAQLEHRGIVRDLLCSTRYDFVDPDRRVVVPSEMKKFHEEAQVIVGPQRVLVAIANGLIAIPVQAP